MSGRRNLVKAVVDLEDRLSRKLGNVGRNVRSFIGEQKKGEAQTRGWEKTLDRWGGKVHTWFGERTKSLVRGWFMSMKVSAAIGFAAVSAGVVQAFNKFTELEATIRNTTGLLRGAGATDAQANRAADAFTKDVMKLAPKLAKSPQDLAASLYDIVGGGFEGADATKVLEAATKGASAGMSETVTVANALVKTLQAYGYGADKAAEVTDAMFQSVNLGIISFDELAQQLGDVVGLAATAGVSFDDLMASVAVMTRKGLVPAEAFTSLNQVMLSILAPAPGAQEAAAEIFGKDVEKKWGAQALAAQGLSGIMSGLMDELNPSPAQIKRLNSLNAEVADMAAAEIAGGKLDVLTSLFGNVRALRGALVLASDEGWTFADAQEEMQKKMGATDRVMAEQEKTVKRQTDRLKALWDVFQLQVMADVAPDVGEKVKEVSGWLAEVMDSPEYKKAKGFGKVKVLGEAIWEWTAAWWEDNKTAITTKITEGINWLGDVATPKVVEFGVGIGKELVPAIWKGLMDTAPGKLMVGAVAASWANKLGPAVGKGVAGSNPGGGAGGGVPAGGAAAGSWNVSNIVAQGLAIYGAVTMTKAAIQTAQVQGQNVANAEAQAEASLRGMSTADLEVKLKDGDLDNLATKIWGAWPGNKTGEELVQDELDRRKPLETTARINLLQDMNLMPAYQAIWDDFSNISRLGKTGQGMLDTAAITGQPNVAYNDPANKNALSQYGNLDDLMEQYLKDPSAMGQKQREVLETFIEATSGSTEKLKDSAAELIDAGVTGEAFNTLMQQTNPILAGMGDISAEWALRTIAAIRDMKKGVEALALAEADAKDLLKWAQSMGWGNNDPDRKRLGEESDYRQGEIRNRKNNAVPDSLPVHQNALGSRGTVTSPTLFLAGEAGAEDFAFTPHLKGGITNGEGGSTVIFKAPLVGEVKVDPEGKSVEEVAAELAKLLAMAVQNGAGS